MALGIDPHFKQTASQTFYAAIGFMAFSIFTRQTRTIVMWLAGFFISLSLGTLAGDIALERGIMPKMANLVSCFAGMSSLLAMQGILWVYSEVNNNKTGLFKKAVTLIDRKVSKDDE
jgi:hypothetical protein